MEIIFNYGTMLVLISSLIIVTITKTMIYFENKTQAQIQTEKAREEKKEENIDIELFEYSTFYDI